MSHITDAAAQATMANEYRFGKDAQIAAASNGALAKLGAIDQAFALMQEKAPSLGNYPQFKQFAQAALNEMSGQFSSPSFSDKPVATTKGIA